MNHGKASEKLVLAFDPSTKGIGFAVFSGPELPVEWGVKEAKANKNKRGLLRVRQLIDFYSPDVIVVEDYAGKGSRRCERVQKLIKDIKRLAKKNKIKTYQYSRAAIRKAFAQFGAKTKYQIAQRIAERLPAFKPKLPPERKLWKPEDNRMNIFDAVSLALTFFYEKE